MCVCSPCPVCIDSNIRAQPLILSEYSWSFSIKSLTKGNKPMDCKYHFKKSKFIPTPYSSNYRYWRISSSSDLCEAPSQGWSPSSVGWSCWVGVLIINIWNCLKQKSIPNKLIWCCPKGKTQLPVEKSNTISFSQTLVYSYTLTVQHRTQTNNFLRLLSQTKILPDCFDS